MFIFPDLKKYTQPTWKSLMRVLRSTVSFDTNLVRFDAFIRYHASTCFIELTVAPTKPWSSRRFTATEYVNPGCTGLWPTSIPAVHLSLMYWLYVAVSEEPDATFPVRWKSCLSHPFHSRTVPL